jgi:hypothetical protein
MSEFIRKYGELRDESMQYITDFLKNNGGYYEFINPEEIELEDFSDMAHQFPQATYVGSTENTYYYTITSVTLEDETLWFNGINFGEDSHEYNFGVNEVDVACLCDCADNLIIKEK